MATESIDLGFLFVFVVVGPSRKPFSLHQNLAITKSAFFKGALASGTFKESYSRVVYLPHQDPEAFDIYMKCLYQGKVFSARDDDDIDGEFRRLASVALLSDFLQDVGTFNLVMDAIIDVAETMDQYPLNLAALVYEQLPPCSPLRKLVRDFWVWHPNPQWYESAEGGDPECDTQSAPSEFWRDVAREGAIVGSKAHIKSVKVPWVKDRCQYHRHLDSERCTP